MASSSSRRVRRLQARRLLDDDVRHAPRSGPAEQTNAFARWFDKHLFKLQFLTILILILSIVSVVWFAAANGDFVRKGVSLAGGTSVTVTTGEHVDQRALEANVLEAFPGVDVSTRILGSAGVQTGFTVDVAGLAEGAEAALASFLREEYPSASISIETTGPSLGASFFRQTLIAVLVAFVFMGIVVFFSFKTFYPSIAVIAAGASTVISTLAVFNLLGLSLSTAGVAAFLMLIGYSIDTDILLSTRILRRDGSFTDNLWSAMKTGLTMQLTTAITVGIILVFSNNAVFDQIMTVILIGMVFDVLYTWVQNAAILKWYVNRKETKALLARGERA